MTGRPNAPTPTPTPDTTPPTSTITSPKEGAIVPIGKPVAITGTASDADPVVIFTLGEGRDSVLNGFTLQNGRAGFDNQGLGEGGGIKVQGSSPT